MNKSLSMLLLSLSLFAAGCSEPVDDEPAAREMLEHAVMTAVFAQEVARARGECSQWSTSPTVCEFLGTASTCA